MNWFITKIIFRITTGDGNHTGQFEEQLRLICARNLDEALQKARVNGLHQEDSYKNFSNETVEWKFIDVIEVNELKNLRDGMELSSRIDEADHPELFLKRIREKANALLQQFQSPVSQPG